MLAALTLWVPALLPYWIGPLSECDHCIETYSMCLPLVPAAIVPTLLYLDDAVWVVVAAVAVLAMLGGLTLALRRLRPPWSAALQTAVILLVGLEA